MGYFGWAVVTIDIKAQSLSVLCFKAPSMTYKSSTENVNFVPVLIVSKRSPQTDQGILKGEV